eukprot:6201788-Pleurochrysis_carterae.AAC.1
MVQRSRTSCDAQWSRRGLAYETASAHGGDAQHGDDHRDENRQAAASVAACCCPASAAPTGRRRRRS